MNQGDPIKNFSRKEQGATYCAEARRLLDSFGSAVQDLVKLHEEQFLSVVEGDLSANRFDLLIHEANERKQLAKYAYMTHLEAHGCSQTNDTQLS